MNLYRIKNINQIDTKNKNESTSRYIYRLSSIIENTKLLALLLFQMLLHV